MKVFLMEDAPPSSEVACVPSFVAALNKSEKLESHILIGLLASLWKNHRLPYHGSRSWRGRRTIHNTRRKTLQGLKRDILAQVGG
jgi:hypothetical protein